MNGQMPYFRCYASEWTARMSGLTRDAKLLLFVAACVAWEDSKSGKATRTIQEWAVLCGSSEIDILVGARELERRPWCLIATEDKFLTIHLPEMDEQASIVTYERDRKREQRSRETNGSGTVPGTHRGREGVKSERATGGGPAPGGPAAPAEDNARHQILRDGLKRIGAKR